MQGNNGSNEPIVLGKLKKQKTSKPFFVIFVFIVLLGVLFYIDKIQDYITSPGTPLNQVYKYFFGDDNAGSFEPGINKDTILTLTSDTVINYEMIVLNQITFNNEEITYTIKTRGSDLNLDKESLYLEVYNSSQKLLRRIKLTGTITSTEITQTVTFSGYKFNPRNTFLGRIYRMTDEDYAKVTFSAPVGNLTCTKDNHSYMYTFNNLALTFVDHTFTFKNAGDPAVYLEKLQYYQNLAKLIDNKENSSAEVVENETGLEFIAKLDLSKIKLEDLGTYLNYDYYEHNNQAKVVKYEMQAKGYNCQ